VLAKKREGDEVGTPETLRWSEMELPELDLSLDLGDRDCVFSPPPGEDEMKSLEVKPGPWSEPKKKKERAVPAALTEEEKKERDSELEIIADRLVATLNAACSRKKKRRK
jgi:hypothetical protein